MSQLFRSNRRFRPRRLGVLALVPLTVLAVGMSAGGASVASVASQQSGASALPAGTYAPQQLLVRFASGTTPQAAAAVNASIGATTAKSFSSLVPNLQLVQLPATISV